MRLSNMYTLCNLGPSWGWSDPVYERVSPAVVAGWRCDQKGPELLSDVRAARRKLDLLSQVSSTVQVLWVLC